MKINIQGKEIELFYTMRMYIIYENITGESVDFENMKSLKQISTLFLSTIMGSAQKQNIQLDITYNDYMEWLDDNGGYIMINKYATWLQEQMESKYQLLADTKQDDKKRKKAKG